MLIWCQLGTELVYVRFVISAVKRIPKEDGDEPTT